MPAINNNTGEPVYRSTHCDKEKTDAIDLHLLVKDFATANEYRKEFFGI